MPRGGRNKKRAAAKAKQAENPPDAEYTETENPLVSEYTGLIRSVLSGVSNAHARRIAVMIVDAAPTEDIHNALKKSGVEDTNDAVGLIIGVLESAKASKANDGGATKEPDAAVSHSSEVVMVTKSRSKPKGRQDPGRGTFHVEKSNDRGQQPSGATTLGRALGAIKRLPKPRSKKDDDIDEMVWSSALQTACEELAVKYGVTNEWEEYYMKMCAVGRSLLAEEIQRKTQRIYDRRASKLQSKQNKTQWQKNPVACDAPR